MFSSFTKNPVLKRSVQEDEGDMVFLESFFPTFLLYVRFHLNGGKKTPRMHNRFPSQFGNYTSMATQYRDVYQIYVYIWHTSESHDKLSKSYTDHKFCNHSTDYCQIFKKQKKRHAKAHWSESEINKIVQSNTQHPLRWQCHTSHARHKIYYYEASEMPTIIKCPPNNGYMHVENRNNLFTHGIESNWRQWNIQAVLLLFDNHWGYCICSHYYQ